MRRFPLATDLCMKSRIAGVAFLIVITLMVALASGYLVSAAEVPQQQPAAASTADVSPPRALLDRYCVTCHNEPVVSRPAVPDENLQHTQLSSLELALDPRDVVGSCDVGFSCLYTSTIAWRDETTPLPMEANPRVVFERLFADTGSTDPSIRTTLFGYYLDKLASTPDGDGSLLDHMLLLYGAGMADSNRHQNTGLPLVLFGAAGGRVKGGRHLMYPEGTPATNVHLSLLDTMGIPVEKMSDSTGKLDLLSGV